VGRTGIEELMIALFGVALLITLVAFLLQNEPLFLIGLMFIIIYLPFCIASIGKILKRKQELRLMGEDNG